MSAVVPIPRRVAGPPILVHGGAKTTLVSSPRALAKAIEVADLTHPEPSARNRNTPSATNCQAISRRSPTNRNFDQKRSLSCSLERTPDWHTGCSMDQRHFALCAAHSDESRWREKSGNPLII